MLRTPSLQRNQTSRTSASTESRTGRALANSEIKSSVSRENLPPTSTARTTVPCTLPRGILDDGVFPVPGSKECHTSLVVRHHARHRAMGDRQTTTSKLSSNVAVGMSKSQTNVLCALGPLASLQISCSGTLQCGTSASKHPSAGTCCAMVATSVEEPHKQARPVKAESAEEDDPKHFLFFNRGIGLKLADIQSMSRPKRNPHATKNQPLKHAC